MIAGASGSGKSGLALRLLSLGAGLVADDITWLTRDGNQILAQCPPTLKGRIEARGIGILNATTQPAFLAWVLDLGGAQSARSPEPATIKLLEQDVPLLHKSETPYFAEALLHYMRYGLWSEPTD